LSKNLRHFQGIFIHMHDDHEVLYLLNSFEICLEKVYGREFPRPQPLLCLANREISKTRKTLGP
jgi:hypothetical protein